MNRRLPTRQVHLDFHTSGHIGNIGRDFNKEQFQNLIAGDKPVLVDFWAPWCVYCRRIAPAYEKMAEQYEDRVVIAKVDIDQEPALAEQEQIEVIPSLVLYRNGKAIGSLVAPESKAMIDAFLAEKLQ